MINEKHRFFAMLFHLRKFFVKNRIDKKGKNEYNNAGVNENDIK